MIEINLFIKQTHRFRERTYGCQGERLGGRESWGVWMCRYTLLHLKWIINKDLLTVQQSTYCTLFNVMWHPGWKQNLGENGHIYMDG